MKFRIDNCAQNQKLTLVSLVICAILSCAIQSQQSLAVTWEQQAERLQLVSASFLDAQPLLSSIDQTSSTGSLRLEGKSIITPLPKLNATVGAKTEQPPQPPAHSIPTGEISYSSPEVLNSAALVRLWAGYLPSSAAKATGMNATCEQIIQGYSFGLNLKANSFVSAAIEGGQQLAKTLVEGAITEENSQDRFDVQSQLSFVILSLTPKQYPNFWIQGQVAERNVRLDFHIPSDNTTFNLSDRSTVSSGNASTQFTLGYKVSKNFQIAGGIQNTPQRSTTPRLLMSYSVATGHNQTKDAGL